MACKGGWKICISCMFHAHKFPNFKNIFLIFISSLFFLFWMKKTKRSDEEEFFVWVRAEKKFPPSSSTELLQQMNKYLAFKCLMAITRQTLSENREKRESILHFYLPATSCTYNGEMLLLFGNMLISILN